MDNPCTAEILIRRMVSGYGFRTGDYTLTWDGGEFDPGRKLHVLTVATRHGGRPWALCVFRRTWPLIPEQYDRAGHTPTRRRPS